MYHLFRNCPICGNDKVESLLTQRFELSIGHPLSTGYELVYCVSCGFIYADTTVSQADYDGYYAKISKYEDKKTSSGGGYNTFDNKRLEVTANQIAAYLQDYSLRILDVGCANGGLLSSLKNLGFSNLCGLDPSPVCVKNTIALGITAYTGSIFDSLHHGQFDCVVLSHTLEHIMDLKGVIKQLSQLVNVSGRQMVYIEVPDSLHYIDYVVSPFQELNTEHINHFSEISLNNLMMLAGFEKKEFGEKIIDIGHNYSYPVIYGFWKKSKPKSTNKIIMDTLSLFSMREYIDQSSAILSKIETHLQKVLQEDLKFIVWGTGQLLVKLLEQTILGKANIVALIDNNPINQGQTLHGLKILPPHKLEELEYPILITSILHQQEIASQIRQMGLQNSIINLSG